MTNDQIARNAASTWCRCHKCDGEARNLISENEPAVRFKCDKDKLETCHKWYDGYRTALIALESNHIINKSDSDNPLAAFSDEELKAENRRRIEARQAALKEERAKRACCKNCKFYGTVNRYGQNIDRASLNRWSGYYCPHRPCKVRNHYRSLTGYEEACEHFEAN